MKVKGIKTKFYQLNNIYIYVYIYMYIYIYILYITYNNIYTFKRKQSTVTRLS